MLSGRSGSSTRFTELRVLANDPVQRDIHLAITQPGVIRPSVFPGSGWNLDSKAGPHYRIHVHRLDKQSSDSRMKRKMPNRDQRAGAEIGRQFIGRINFQRVAGDLQSGGMLRFPHPGTRPERRLLVALDRRRRGCFLLSIFGLNPAAVGKLLGHKGISMPAVESGFPGSRKLRLR